MEKKTNTNTWSKASAEQIESRISPADRVFLDTVHQFETMQSTNMKRMAEVIESDPVLKAQMEQARRNEHMEKFGSLDFSQLEDRVSESFTHTSDKTRGVVKSYPIMGDNLPRDGRIKLDAVPGERMLQTDTHMGDVVACVSDEQVSEFDQAITKGLTEMLGVKDIYTEASSNPKGCPVGPTGVSGLARSVAPMQTWSASSRDRAATPASVRKKLRTRTRAQKKARRKQR